MDVEVLQRDMIGALAEVDALIEAQKRAFRPAVGWPTIYHALDTNGRPLLSDLLCAKANLLVSLANLPDPT